MGCQKKYTVSDVKNILNYSEGVTPKDAKTVTKTIQTLFGELTLAMFSDDKTGHAQARHLLITEGGLRERTLPKGDDAGLPQASAFLTDKLNNLIFVITALLNCDKGQQALGAMDLYAEQGKMRVVVVEDGSVLSCTHINTRVFYRGDDKVTNEKLVRAAMVLDSNIGGKHPFKIVTAFPCKEDPVLQVTMSDVMIQCRDLTKAGKNPFLTPVKDLLEKAAAWTKKSVKKIPNDLLHGNTLVLGEKFTSFWFKPNPALYKYRYPPVEDKDADERSDGKPNYAKDAAGKPKEPRMSIPMLKEQTACTGIKVLEVDYGKKFVIPVGTGWTFLGGA